MRLEMGLYGRKYALENYELNDCFRRVEKIYYSLKDR